MHLHSSKANYLTPFTFSSSLFVVIKSFVIIKSFKKGKKYVDRRLIAIATLPVRIVSFNISNSLFWKPPRLVILDKCCGLRIPKMCSEMTNLETCSNFWENHNTSPSIHDFISLLSWIEWHFTLCFHNIFNVKVTRFKVYRNKIFITFIWTIFLSLTKTLGGNQL